MRLALLSQSCDNETGIGRIVLSLAREFCREGHEVHVLAQHLGGLKKGIHGHRVVGQTRFNSINKLLFHSGASQVLRQLHYDIVNCFGVGKEATVATAQSCHLAALKFLEQYRHKRIWRHSWGVFDRVSLRDERRLLTSPHTQRIIAVSSKVKQEIVSFYGVDPDRIAVIPNGVHHDLITRLTTPSHRENIRRNLNLTSENFVWLFVGNEFDRKGLQTVIECLALVNDNQDHLVVVGADNPNSYKRLAFRLNVLERMTFLGGVSGPERIYAAADVFVFPTLYEAFGLVVLEAMAAGIPVVATRTTGAAEGMLERKHGLFLDDPLSALDLATAVKGLKSDSKLREDIILHARAEAAKYSWNAIAGRTLAVFEQVRQ